MIQLLEEKKLKKSDFIVTENYHIRLQENTAKMLIDRIKANFNCRSLYKKRNSTYDTILQDNVQQLANYLLDKSKKLEFDIPVVRISRNVDLEIRETLLSISPDQRKELGINKSTLWYIQKNLRDGKRIQIYDKVQTKMK